MREKSSKAQKLHSNCIPSSQETGDFSCCNFATEYLGLQLDDRMCVEKKGYLSGRTTVIPRSTLHSLRQRSHSEFRRNP